MNISKWCVDLPGDPAWWQALAGLFQAVFAAAIVFVTQRYVGLTNRLVTSQEQVAAIQEHVVKSQANLVKLKEQVVRSQEELVTLQKQAVKRELYDRRLKVFLSILAFIAQFARELKIALPDVHQLLSDTL